MIQGKETKEKRQHSTTYIPYSCYECHIPEYYNNVPMHWHREFEINYILMGKGEFICGDDKFVAGEGDLLVMPPNMLHAAYPYQDNPLIYTALVFHPAMLGANSNDRATAECIRPVINGNIKINMPVSRGRNHYDELKLSADHIFSCAKSNLPSGDLLLKSELLRFFWLLEDDEAITSRDETKISYSELIRPALQFMMENFRENITVEQLADLVHLSKSYFMGCFKKAVGVGAMEHLTQLRMNAACDALSSTDKMISDISFHCGYSNLSNFNRQFKKVVGCTPNEYRKQNKTGDAHIH